MNGRAVVIAPAVNIFHHVVRLRLTGHRHVSLTELGSEKLAVAPEPLQAEFYRKFRALEDWEQQMLLSALHRVAKMMDADDLDVAPILQAGAIDEPSPWG